MRLLRPVTARKISLILTLKSLQHTGNILLMKSETGNIVAKLADGHFQDALHALQNDKSIQSQGLSPTGWIAPEASNGFEALLQTDVWDLGICKLLISLSNMPLGLKASR